MRNLRILIHCPVSVGGIAEYSHYQANALSELGADVTLLCPRGFMPNRLALYRRVNAFPEDPRRGTGLKGLELVRHGLYVVRRIVANELRLPFYISAFKPDAVHLGSYMEYFSPFWIWPRLAGANGSGPVYSANLHDPVRDLIVGPRWWQDWSERLAYRPLKIGLVHSRLRARPRHADNCRIIEVPHGVFDLAESSHDALATRAGWGIGPEMFALLSFGFIRDNKNLDLLIKALPRNEKVCLVVMGRSQSAKDKPVQYYRDLAEQCGVADRVLFRDEFVPDEALPGVFRAADAIALTYDRTFHSQSGVLNIAARARKPVLASSGEGPLADCVRRFHLGAFVEPDDQAALEEGMRFLVGHFARGRHAESPAPEPDWKGYEEFASWRTNAQLLLDTLSETIESRRESVRKPLPPTLPPQRSVAPGVNATKADPRYLVYLCDQSVGGIAKNSFEQAKALTAAGIKVDFICPRDWKLGDLPAPSRVICRIYPGPKHGQWAKVISRALSSVKMLQNLLFLDAYIKKTGARHVMIGCYAEYLAPFWVPRMKRHARNGVVFGGMALDPVRDYVVGPLWWHLRSVAEAYSFYREMFLHKQMPLDTVRHFPGQRVSVVPHGPYYYPAAARDRAAVRKDLGIPESAKVFLSFGHLRDSKNLHLAIEALAQMPEDTYLLVAGSEAAPGQRTSAEYRAIARRFGVQDRIRWAVRYIAEDEVNSFFDAADFVTMAYSSSFRSTSGILHVATPKRIPVLVSCGDAPLGDMVEDYNLGLRVQPDSVGEIVRGMKYLLEAPHHGEWDRFVNDFSYEENAHIVAEKLFEQREFPQ
jgi:glycosyltransferase involved in cell wall biosynthesis